MMREYGDGRFNGCAIGEKDTVPGDVVLFPEYAYKVTGAKAEEPVSC